MSESCNHHSHIDVNRLCVAKVPFFNHLTNEEMFKIVDLSRNLRFKKGEIILHDGDSLDYLYIVHKGRVKIYQLFESGKEQLLRILHSGEFMGEMALFAEKVVDSFAEAMTDTEICAIHRNDMQQLMQTHPSIALKILEQFSTRLEETEKMVGQLSAKDVEARTANFLLDLVEEKGSSEIALPMSKKDLASYLGTTRETISRRLSAFEANGWIKQEGHRKITVLNAAALKETAAEM